MNGRRGTPDNSLTPALEAIGNLARQELSEIFHCGQMAGLSAHSEIELAPTNQKSAAFYRHFLPLRQDLVSVLAGGYRRYFKLALAHPRQTGRDPHQWVWAQFQPAVGAALEWIRDWYMLACDGENQYVRRMGSTEVLPGQTVSLSIPSTAPPFPPPKSWCGRAWLFHVSLALFGVGLLKTEHVPATNSEEKLSAAHTRLLIKGARRVFLRELGAAIETVRNEEIAATGAISAETVKGQTRGPNKRKGWEQREKLYRAIREALTRNPSLEGMEFCAELDRRHAPPLFDWTKSGEGRNWLSWKAAWRDPRLRRKIRRVRQEAMKGR